MAVDQDVLQTAVTRLLRALRTENDAARRTAPAWTVCEQVILTSDLHEVAQATQLHLHKAAQMDHPLYKWTVVYVPDGAFFVATAPS